MAKNSRTRIGMAGTILALALPLCGAVSSGAAAGGLPLRATAVVHDRALSGLAEGLDFKLTHVDKTIASTDQAAWTAMVEETVLIAARLGCPTSRPVTAQRAGRVYAVVLDGDSVVAGADPDQVLGRLLYMLAHADAETHAAEALAILDQPLSVTLAALPLSSTSYTPSP